MKYFFLIFFTLALVSFFFGTMGLYAFANLRFMIIFPLLAVAIIQTAKVPNAIGSSALVSVWAFLGWCLITCFWSENFSLSLLKLLLFSTTVLAFFLGGAVLPRLYPRLNPYLALAPIFLVSVLGAVIHPEIQDGNLRGLSGNSNMQAATIMFTFPWLFVEVARRWSTPLKRNLLLALGALAVLTLVLSRSRTMILSTLVAGTVVFTSLRPGRKVLTLYFAIAALMMLVIAKPDIIGDVTQVYVFKSSSHILQSRESQLQESLQSARNSGPLGIGFGVSTGVSRFWSSGSFSEFSREKGNSILAVWEETGLVGAGLWTLSMCVLAISLRSRGKSLPAGSHERFLYFVAFGFLLGCLVSSMGEAWVLSPSPETAVFWATMGVSFGALKSDSMPVAAMRMAA